MTFENQIPFCALSLQGLRLKVKLGWSENERAIPQEVSFDIRVRFPSLPNGCKTDQLSETLCYAKICQEIQDLCLHEEYRLIERLGYTVFSSLKNFIPDSVQLWLRITKVSPPIPHLELQGGASFSIGDWNAF
jgi:dihydroneopterin aldolase